MPENRFEKDVQQQMEELQLRPSEVVWKKVEAELQKKKRRRVIFIFFILAGLGLIGYTGYIFSFNSNKNLSKELASKPINNPADQTATNSQTISPKGNAQNSRPEETDQAALDPDSKEFNSKTGDETAGTEPVIAHNPGQKSASTSIQTTQVNSQANNRRKRKKENQTSERLRKGIIADQIADDMLKTDQRNPITSGDKNPDIVSKAADSLSIASSQQKRPADLLDTAVNHVDTLTKTTPIAKAKKRKKTIDWGVEGSFGVTTRNSRRLPSIFDGQKANNVLYTPANVNATGSFLVLPSPTKAGIAFQAGLTARVNLSQKNRILTGIIYSYQSDRITTGSYRDTNVVVNNAISPSYTVATLYAVSGGRSYTNSYHSLFIPIRYERQLTNGKLPLNWNIGVNVGYLFSSNALVYDTVARGSYYKDRSAFHKLHFSASSGLNLAFGKPGGMQWSIGPEFTTDMTRLLTTPYDKRQYLFYTGITGRVLFTNKSRQQTQRAKK